MSLTPQQQAIVECARAGLTKRETAERLGIKLETLRWYWCLLVQSGHIERRRPGAPRSRTMTARMDRVVELARRGLSKREIAVEMGVSIGTVKWLWEQLLAEGRIAARRAGGSKPRPKPVTPEPDLWRGIRFDDDRHDRARREPRFRASRPETYVPTQATGAW